MSERLGDEGLEERKKEKYALEVVMAIDLADFRDPSHSFLAPVYQLSHICRLKLGSLKKIRIAILEASRQRNRFEVRITGVSHGSLNAA